jgi:hypothetical protein
MHRCISNIPSVDWIGEVGDRASEGQAAGVYKHNHRSNAFEKDTMDTMESNNSAWNIGRRLKSCKHLENRPIDGATGLKYNALDKANAIRNVWATTGHAPRGITAITLRVTEALAVFAV